MDPIRNAKEEDIMGKRHLLFFIFVIGACFFLGNAGVTVPTPPFFKGGPGGILQSPQEKSPLGKGGRELLHAGALTLECENAVKRYNQAIARKDLAEKVRLLKKALEISCGDKQIQAKIHNNLADAYENQGHLDKAIEEYQQAIKANPYLSTPYLSLGDVYTKLKRPKAAARFYDEGFLLQNFKSPEEDNYRFEPAKVCPGEAIRGPLFWF